VSQLVGLSLLAVALVVLAWRRPWQLVAPVAVAGIVALLLLWPSPPEPPPERQATPRGALCTMIAEMLDYDAYLAASRTMRPEYRVWYVHSVRVLQTATRRAARHCVWIPFTCERAINQIDPDAPDIEMTAQISRAFYHGTFCNFLKPPAKSAPPADVSTE
jgi:hypothetical protein